MLILPHPLPAVRKLLAAWQRDTACKPSCRGWCVDALRLGRANTTRSGKHLRIRLCEGPRRPIRSASPASRDPPHLRLSRLQQLLSSGGLVRSLAGCDNDAPKPSFAMLMLHRHVCTPLIARQSPVPLLLRAYCAYLMPRLYHHSPPLLLPALHAWHHSRGSRHHVGPSARLVQHRIPVMKFADCDVPQAVGNGTRMFGSAR
ncbi:hypothetical protein BKA58DRAFT_401027 [Alternaria rosae]|uniref:uncharacterized protein n=1 Tax=Alternaria rosae TaxID=1187941 RepID=UPI001E8CEE44|nr:uncharacterized protein BKA58DRAFT_401027 [Alternaria rosae]KAH6872840.1 hypothetical protein BKA58DRAFT_401027 [Alternaria rosae]